ncbi:MAG: prepilin-type N-terminal cleavage/methylation domain-containing protein [Opitutales bacterium]|nr:prepilin-type N-terminal cleavage/methylation domain-containing protein [Opitutales bacterium]
MGKERTEGTENGFSLVEVVLALGIFGVMILAVVALLSPTLRTVRETAEADNIPRLPTLLRGELQKNPEWWVDWSPGDDDGFLLFYADQGGEFLFRQSSFDLSDPLTNFRNRFYGVKLEPALREDGTPEPFFSDDTLRRFQVTLYWPASQLTGPLPDDPEGRQGFALDENGEDLTSLNRRAFVLALRR